MIYLDISNFNSHLFIYMKKLIIFSYFFHNPVFLAYQNKCFKKQQNIDIHMVVFDDSINKKLQIQTEEECKKYKFEYIKIPQSIHTMKRHPSHRHQENMNWSMKIYDYSSYDYMLLLDSDAFIYTDFMFEHLMNKYDMVSKEIKLTNNTFNQTVRFLHVGFLLMNLKSIDPSQINFKYKEIKFKGQTIIRTDTGGSMLDYLDKKKPRIYYIDFDTSFDVLQQNLKICKKTNGIFHFENGSGWRHKQDLHNYKLKMLAKTFIFF